MTFPKVFRNLVFFVDQLFFRSISKHFEVHIFLWLIRNLLSRIAALVGFGMFSKLSVRKVKYDVWGEGALDGVGLKT